MLEPPPVSDDAIAACLEGEYALRPTSLSFLPLGADLGTAVYRVASREGRDYFVKLRFGRFDEMAALVPRWLADQGIAEILAPLPARSGRPFTPSQGFTLLLHPFVEGRDAYEVTLSDSQWAAFGRSARRVHDAALPAALAQRLPREVYNPKWRNDLRRSLLALDDLPRLDRVGQEYAAFLDERRAQVLDLVERTDRLAAAVQAADLPGVLCHTDLHPGNLLVCPDGRFYVVDWDAPLLAPRERDLMYPGGALGFPGRSPEQEEALFYEGYGPVRVDLRAVAYYRLERIIEDLAIFGDQLLTPAGGDVGGSEADREQALQWAMSNFLPGHVLEIADMTYRRLV